MHTSVQLLPTIPSSTATAELLGNIFNTPLSSTDIGSWEHSLSNFSACKPFQSALKPSLQDYFRRIYLARSSPPVAWAPGSCKSRPWLHLSSGYGTHTSFIFDCSTLGDDSNQCKRRFVRTPHSTWCSGKTLSLASVLTNWHGTDQDGKNSMVFWRDKRYAPSCSVCLQLLS